MGPMYGYNWRHHSHKYNGMNGDYKKKGFDQIKYVLDLIKVDPMSRRIIITTFDPATSNKGVLYPCHGLITQWYIRDKYLDCVTYCRSQDLFLGTPFNIASYALLVHIFAYVTGHKPGKLKMYLGDCHCYMSHLDAIKTQLD